MGRHAAPTGSKTLEDDGKTVSRQPWQRLTGVRRAYGLLLEASDVVLPIARRLFDFAQEGIQHLLVLVIGRSLGLILRGVRESLKGTAAIGREAEGTNKDEEFPLMRDDSSFSFSY